MDADLLTVAVATGPSVATALGRAVTAKRAHASQSGGFVLFCVKLLVNTESLSAAIFRMGLLRTGDGLINYHSRDRFSILFLFRRVNPMRLRINGEAMDSMLDVKIFQLTIVI
jgi:hypothetical protein